MTFDLLFEEIEKGAYTPNYQHTPPRLPDTHIEDENQTVVWNREFVKVHNEKRNAILQINKSMENACIKRFMDDLASAIMDEFPVNQNQTDHIMVQAYEEGHSAGYYEVVQDARELAQFYSHMKELE